MWRFLVLSTCVNEMDQRGVVVLILKSHVESKSNDNFKVVHILLFTTKMLKLFLKEKC